jgi:uncharacterized 2Fe-2S/4Fe-4S cluster protein (DUF4445 family)
MYRVTVNPGEMTFHAQPGTPVRAFLLHNGILVDFPCGGKGYCSQCRVLMDPAPASGKGGRNPLPDDEVGRGVRLACTALIEGDCTITVPEGRRAGAIWRDPTTLDQTSIIAGEALTTRATVRLDPPSLEDQRGDWERLDSALRALGYTAHRPAVPELERISRVLRESSWNIEAILENGHVVSCCRSFDERLYGFAVDLGTTTVDVSLHSVETGRSIGRATMLNRQAAFGADVISRAQAFSRDRKEVRDAATRTIAECAQSVLAEAGVSPAQVVRTVVVGNPIMIHILHDLDPMQLTQAPYICATTSMLRRAPSDFGWSFQGHGCVESLPLISAFVGADTVGMIVALDLDKEELVSLSIDIGTNGEIVLSQKGQLTTTSTAAGPAFEGAQISCGMRALSGSIVAVGWDGADLTLKTVGGGKPLGMAGTGLISLIALLLDRGAIDSTGRLLEKEEIPDAGLRRRIVRTPRDEPGLRLSEDGSVYVSQRDIRELQLAKGAVRTGIESLLRAKGIASSDLDAIRLAGNFGGALDVRAAMRIGLIPSIDPEKVDVVGNAALRGAALALVSRTYRRKAEETPRIATFLELAGKPEFQMLFADAMMFEAP